MAGRHQQKNQNVKPVLTPEQQKKRKKRRIILFSSIGAGIILLGCGLYFGLTRSLDHGIASKVAPAKVKTPFDSQNRINILMIGTDTRPGESGGNTDVLIVCSIDNEHKRIEMMSIPRDTKILYPDGSYAKINESLDLGGPQLTVNLVQNLLDFPIKNFAVTHFGGLVNVINTIGGIQVDVKEPMHYNTGDKQYNIIDLNPGVQTLNGEQALGFVRFRHDNLGDIGRTVRQQEFLTALFNKLRDPQNIPRLPQLVQEFSSTVDTNMNLLDVGSLATNATRFKNYPIVTETLPGAFHNPVSASDASYWIVNPLQAKYETKRFFDQGLKEANAIQDESQTLNWTPPTPTTANNSTANNSTANNSTTANNGSGGGSTSNSVSTNTSAANTDNNTASSTPSSVTSLPETKMSVTANSAYIRSGPGSNYAVVGSAMHGQSVYVIGKSGDWDEVRVNANQTGYMASFLLGPTN